MLLEIEQERWREMISGVKRHKFERLPLYSIIFMEYRQLCKKRYNGQEDELPKSYSAFYKIRMEELIRERKEWRNDNHKR